MSRLNIGPDMGPPKSRKAEKARRVPRAKHDPKHIAAARELRDRWLEQVNEHPALISHGKYDVSRAIATRDAKRAALQLSAA